MSNKFILIEHGHGPEDPATLTICDDQKQLELATRIAIYGDAEHHCPELAVLHREGIVRFEGDPPIEWLIVGKIINFTR